MFEFNGLTMIEMQKIHEHYEAARTAEYVMENFPTASELREKTEAKNKILQGENHKKWLESVSQGILDASEHGYLFCKVDCLTLDDIEELRMIYEPLGYKVSMGENMYHEPNAVIMW